MAFLTALKALPLGIKLLGGAIAGYGAVSVYKKRQAASNTDNFFGTLPPLVQGKVVNAIDMLHDSELLKQLGDGLARGGAAGAAIAAHEKALVLQTGPVIDKLVMLPQAAAAVAPTARPAVAHLLMPSMGMTTMQSSLAKLSAMGVAPASGPIASVVASVNRAPTPTTNAPVSAFGARFNMNLGI